MIRFLINLLVHSPFYPHWLEFLKARSGTRRVLRGIHGAVLEVGAGDGSRKRELLSRYREIDRYVSTDFSSWDDEFEKIDQKVLKRGFFEQLFIGHQKREVLDIVCSATDLPFDGGVFDYHLSFEVLEHIDDPFQFFHEAARVLKPGGKVVVVVPFLYRMHGGENVNHRMDFFRYAKGFFYSLSERYPLDVVGILHNTGFGTTGASLLNQYVVRRIVEGNIFVKIFLTPVAPFLFFLSNSIGYLLDIYPDERFATRFHIVLKKRA